MLQKILQSPPNPSVCMHGLACISSLAQFCDSAVLMSFAKAFIMQQIHTCASRIYFMTKVDVAKTIPNLENLKILQSAPAAF